MDQVKEIFEKVVTWVKGNTKIVIGIVAAIVVVIVAASIIGGGQKRAVKKYVKAFAKMDVKSVLKTYDVKGALAWAECNEKPKKFKDAYDDIDDDDVEEAEEDAEELFESLDDEFDKLSIKVKKITSVKKEKNCKGMYKVKAKLKIKYETDEKDNDIEKTVEFVVYKNKVIDSDLLSVISKDISKA